MSAIINEESMLRTIRASLWVLIVVVTLLGSAAALLAIAPDSEAAGIGQNLMKLLPLLIVIAGAAIGQRTRGTPEARAALRALLDDELRQASLQRAWRNGFFTALVVQAPLLMLSTLAVVSSAPAMMASLTITSALGVALATVLWYDR